MNRDIGALEAREFDLIVIGGGSFGAAAAWDAALRGLSVALVERGDFCGATSANSFKIIHGGIRYLQHIDVVRIRQSVRERRALLRIAPQLVHPLPIVVPTYGHGWKGRAALRAALTAYDLLAWDRNGGVANQSRHLPAGRLIARDEALSLFPGLPHGGLTGAAVFCDGQMYSPPRLVLAFVQSAVSAGAVVANHAGVTELLCHENRVRGVRCCDVLSNRFFVVRGRHVLNAAGPFAEQLLRDALGVGLKPPGRYSRDSCFVVRRRPEHEFALAIPGQTHDPDAVLSRGARHLFLAPWRGYTLVGTWHKVHDGGPDEFKVTRRELQAHIDEVNRSYPTLDITLADVSTWNAGLVPFGENEPGAVNLSYGKRSRRIDHRNTDGIEGLTTLIGVRHTTARGEASEAVDRIVKHLGVSASAARTDSTPLVGSAIDDLDALHAEAEHHAREIGNLPEERLPDIMHALVRGYGTNYTKILGLVRDRPDLGRTLGNTDVLRAQIVYAVRSEMAERLGDVVFRRTHLGTAEHPGEEAIEECATIMAEGMEWGSARMSEELDAVRSSFQCPRTSEPAVAAGAADRAVTGSDRA